MLKTVEVKNFQSLEDVQLDLVPNGVNVIVGPTDSGKSALFRALMLLFENSPPGWAYKSWFVEAAASTMVRVTTDMDDAVARVRSASRNVYIINHNEVLAASTMPEAVKTMLPVNASNFQPQHKPYFMLQDTPGSVGAEFAKIAGLHIIDSATDFAETRVRNIRAKKVRLKETIQQLKETVKAYEPLAEMEPLLADAQQIKAEIVQTQTSIADLTDLRNQILTKNAVVWRFADTINQIEPKLWAAVNALNKAVDGISKTLSVRSIIARHGVVKSQLDEINEVVGVLEPLYQDLTTSVTTALSTKTSCDQLYVLLMKYYDTRYNITKLDDEITTLETHIQTTLDTLGYCPLCGVMRGDTNATADIGGLAHTCEQPKTEDRRLPTNTISENRVSSRMRKATQVSAHSSTRRHD